MSILNNNAMVSAVLNQERLAAANFSLNIYAIKANMTKINITIITVESGIGFGADESTAIRPADAEGTSTVHVEGFTV